jgi:catechol 2,3-dioxygenase-like lactoylglutathione lyase family enzyme
MDKDFPVTEMRVALTTRDYERLLQFYCDGLGLEPAEVWNNEQGKGLMLDLGHATLELFDEAQATPLTRSKQDGASADRCASHFRYQT